MVVNTPVDSTTYWAPASPHLMLAGSLLKISYNKMFNNCLLAKKKKKDIA